MDVVIEEKRYTGENVSRDSFRIIGAYANYSDAYMAAKKQLVTAETVTDPNVIKTMFRSEENRC
jgi:hypothetical protein